MPERIAITGANGFLGRHLTAFASRRGWDVVGLVRSEAAERVVRDAGGRPARVQAEDARAVETACAGARAMVHLAGISAPRGAATYERVNVEGTRRVVLAARRAGVRRVVFVSGLGVARYGMAPRSTNGYFLAKLTCELELFRSGLEVAVLRPSFILGPEGEFLVTLLREMAEGEVEQIGDGAHRLQPIAVADVAELLLACASRPQTGPIVVDAVGPEPLTYSAFIARVAEVARRLGLPADYRIREVAVAEADRLAAVGGYRGLLPDELDVLLCDEVADCRPAEAVLERALTPLTETIEAAIRGIRPGSPR